MDDFESEQAQFCVTNEEQCEVTHRHHIIGFATGTLGAKPINGLRHPTANPTSGWYIWCGEEFSDDPEFFSPMHAEHLADHLPEAIKYLGLPPGFRFLTDGDYSDVWFDPGLLNVSDEP